MPRLPRHTSPPLDPSSPAPQPLIQPSRHSAPAPCSPSPQPQSGNGAERGDRDHLNIHCRHVKGKNKHTPNQTSSRLREKTFEKLAGRKIVKISPMMVCFGGPIFDPSRHLIESSCGGKKELLMECSHWFDPLALPGRKAGDR